MVSESPSYSPPKPVAPPPDDTDWSGPPAEDDPWVDVPAIQRRLDARNKRWGGLNFHQAVFRMPWPVTQRQYEEYRKAAGERWVKVMAAKGWTLRSKIEVSKPRPSYGMVDDWYEVPLLDQREFLLAAAFSINAKPVRIELPIKVLKERPQ